MALSTSSLLRVTSNLTFIKGKPIQLPIIFCSQDPARNKLSPPRTTNRRETPIHPDTPFPSGVPTLLNIRHLSKSTDGGIRIVVYYFENYIITSTTADTPNNNVKPSPDSDDWTPFSSVSSDAYDRTSACVSLMDDLSQSTISTPIRDIRQQMVDYAHSPVRDVCF